MRLFLSIAILVTVCLAEDPEITMTTPQIIQRWGYPVEVHHVTTSDGYILELHRIPHGKNEKSENVTRPIIFMQHGLLCASSNWVANLPNESAGFLFADAGFDVWMGNVRGNTYSFKHSKYTTDDKNYWDFTWDEMAAQDMPAMINYALETSGQDSLYYMGHSQGTLTMFAALSEKAGFASKIKKFFALAPIGTVKHISGAMAVIAHRFGWLIRDWEWMFGSKDFLPTGIVMKLLSESVCNFAATDAICDNILFLMAGPESNQFNKSRTATYTAHVPAGTSSLNILHWIQMVQRGTVSKYDYGSVEKNHEHYGTFNPPQYDFTNIKTPIYLYWGDSDILADEEDVTGWLIPKLSGDDIKKHYLHGFSHLDFIWGMRAADEVYNPIIKICSDDWKRN